MLKYWLLQQKWELKYSPFKFFVCVLACTALCSSLQYHFDTLGCKKRWRTQHAAAFRYTMVVLWGIVVPHIAHAQTQTVYGIRLNINISGLS